MSRILCPRHLVAASLLTAISAALPSTGCTSDRVTFVDAPTEFKTGDAGPADECRLQCSLDRRSVIDTCTGATVETCRTEQACGAGACQAPCAAAAADSSSNGCDFYLHPPAFRIEQACFAAYVVNTSAIPAEVTLELKGEKLDISKSMYQADPANPGAVIPHTGPVPAGDTVILYLSDQDRSTQDGASSIAAPCPEGVIPATFVEAIPSYGTGRGASFHLTSNVPVGLTSIYPAAGGKSFVTTATLLLPVPLWGKENMMVDAWTNITRETGFTGRGPTEQIVASEDDTEVTVHPSNAIQDGTDVVGTAQDYPVTYRLQRGEVIQFHQFEALTGSVVVSNKPVSVFGGHECPFIPSNEAACDYAQQQLPSLAQWGSEYAAVGYRSRKGGTEAGNETEPMAYRIVAARDGTKLDYDPPIPPSGAPLELAAGQVATFSIGVGQAFVVRTQDADHPIYVAAHMTGAVAAGLLVYGKMGDPEFVNVVPAQQYQSAYSFYADPTYAETSLAIIRRKTNGAFRDVWLECAGVLTDWKPIGVRGEYEWRRVDLARRGGTGDTFDGGTCSLGLQRMRSDGEFTATLWGWDSYVSYAYPGGMALRKTSSGSFAPVH